MPWAKFDDRYPWHRKIRGLSDAAFRMDVSAVCWCAENLTDGVIEPAFLSLVSDVRNPRKAAAELVKAGRWHGDDHECEVCPPVEAGAHVIHDYLVYNPTREKVEKDREQRRKAGEKGGAASGRARSKDEASRFDSAKQTGSETEATAASSPTNPRTRTPTPNYTTEIQGGSHVSSGPGNDAPPLYPDHCRKHARIGTPGNCGDCKDQREANKVLGLRHLSAVPFEPTQQCLIHMEPDVAHCRGCAADAKAAG